MDSLQRVLDQKKSECLEKNRLQNDIDAHAAKAVEKVAREKYNLCRPGEVIYTYDSEPFKAKQEESTK
jgi:cell division protein FtsB